MVSLPKEIFAAIPSIFICGKQLLHQIYTQMTPVQQEVKKTRDMSPLAIILCADFLQKVSDFEVQCHTTPGA